MSSFIIEVIDDDNCVETDHLNACLKRITWNANVSLAKIFVSPRVPLDAPEYKHPGWLEYLISITYTNGSAITIGAIQRKPGAPIEFHS